MNKTQTGKQCAGNLHALLAVVLTVILAHPRVWADPGEATPVSDEDVRQALESRPIADDKAVRNRLGEVLAGTWVTDGKVPGRVVFEDTFASGSWQGQWEDGYSERGSIVVVDDRRGGKCVKLPPRPRDFNCLRLRRESWIKVDPSRQLAVLWEVRQEDGGHPAFIQFDFYDADGKKVRGDYQLRSNVDPTQPPLFQRNAHLVSARMPSSAALMSITFHHCPKEVDEQASEVASVRVVDLAAAIDGVLAREKPVREGRMRAGADVILVYCDDNLTASYPVMPTGAAVPGSAGRTLRIRECPGERTRATVVLWSKSGHRDIEVRISDLKDKQGHVMPSSALSAKVVKAHYQAEGAPGGFLALSDRQVLVPELLLNDDRLVVPDHAHKRNLVKYRWQGREWYVDINSVRRTRFNERITVPTMPIYDARHLLPFDLEAGQNKQLAIRISVPSNAVPGLYGGKIDFVESGKSVACLAVELDVLPFSLPEMAETIYDPAQEFTMGLYVWPTIGRTGEDLLSARERSRTQVLDEYRVLVDNGVTYPAFIWNNDIVFDDANFRRHLSVVREAGFPGKTLHLAASGHIGNDTDPTKLRQMQERLVRAKSVAREFGFDDVYFYGFDEARGERLLSQIPAWKAAHEVGAKVMVSGYAAHFKMVGEWLDLLVFADNAAGADPSAWHAKGHKIWKYDSPQSGPEDPGIFRRNYGMDIWKRGYDGACTYSDIGDGTFWNDVAGYRRMRANGGNGNAYRSLCMLYPTADGVVETLALTGLESAIKDIRILTKFRQLLRKRPHAEAQRWFDAIDPSVADLVKVRREALDWILRLSGESAGR